MIFPRRNFRKLLGLTAIVLTSGLLSDAAAADTIYKTVDAQGNVSFSNTPPAPGVAAQQIELQAGPTPAQQQQSIQTEQNLEAQSNEITGEDTGEASAEEQEEPAVVEPTTEYQQESGDVEDDDQPVVVDEGDVVETDRDERLRDAVDDVREVTPLPAEVQRPAGRVR